MYVYKSSIAICVICSSFTSSHSVSSSHLCTFSLFSSSFSSLLFSLLSPPQHIGLLKAKLAKLKREILAPKGGGGGATGAGFEVTKSGDARVGLIGFPSVGTLSSFHFVALLVMLHAVDVNSFMHVYVIDCDVHC